MTPGTAYLLLCAFVALFALTVVEPLVGEVAASLEGSAATLRQIAHE